MSYGANNPNGLPLGLPSIVSLGLAPGVNPYPALDLDFINNQTLDSRITFTRASSATFFDSAGVLQTAASGAARFTYNPATLQPQGLLIEEQRANLCLQSADFGTTWTATNATVTTNAVVSPDGTTNADNVFETTTNGEHYVRQLFTGLTANTVHTVSVFVKNLGGRNLRIRVLDTDNTANGYAITVSPSLGTIVTAAVAIGSGASVSGAISAVGNNWYRVTLSGNAGATCTKYILEFFSYDGGTAVFVGDVTKGLTLFGAQLEVGAFPTSYIPTTTTALTRNADAASMTGTNFSGWYNASEGTLYAEGIPIPATSTFDRVASIETSGAASVISIQRDSANARGFGDGVSTIVANQMPQNVIFKAALAGKVNDFALVANGSAPNADTSTNALPAAAALGIGSTSAGLDHMNGTIRRIAYYPTRLSNAQLQALTG